jgi:hypothetical protein
MWYVNIRKFLIWIHFGYYINECLQPLKTSSFNENNVSYECKVLWNKIVKKIEIEIFNFFLHSL